MSFSQSTITEGPLFSTFGADLLVSWTSSSPDGTVFHLYLDKRLVWTGTARSVVLPYPNDRGLYQVGTVDDADAETDFSDSLPAVDGDGGAARVRLTWQGGTYLDTDISGFHIYGEDTPGGGIDYGTVLATVPAYSNGIITDGWGMGGWGEGGWGHAASNYDWTSDPLTAGTWNFGVKAFDTAGNEGTADTASFLVEAPPLPPAPDANGRRLAYSYDKPSLTATLSWAASPG